ncbi:hypothetical protein OAK04_02035 [Verrucomicrobia bacterium]|nr:hypothetical protein [Verrucomicrobiota bacterium]
MVEGIVGNFHALHALRSPLRVDLISGKLKPVPLHLFKTPYTVVGGKVSGVY